MGHEDGDKQRPTKRRHVQGMLDETDPLKTGLRIIHQAFKRFWTCSFILYFVFRISSHTVTKMAKGLKQNYSIPLALSGTKLMGSSTSRTHTIIRSVLFLQ